MLKQGQQVTWSLLSALSPMRLKLIAAACALQKANMSSEKIPKVCKGSILCQEYEGTKEYQNMKVELSWAWMVEDRFTQQIGGPLSAFQVLTGSEVSKVPKSFTSSCAKTLGSLDSASLFILFEDLEVNLDVLGLNALGLMSHAGANHTGNAEIKKMKREGLIKKGKFNKKDDQAIIERWKALLKQTGLKEEDLKKELFAATKPGCYTDRPFMLKRQAIGFYLLHGLRDGDRRLPMEAYNRLAVLLFAGTFTKEEDEKILAWVEEHGPKDWTKLARSLGRKYAGAGPSVQQRYEELEGRLKGNRQGTYVFEENSCIFKEVLKQVPEAFEKRIEESKINFKAIASLIGRSNRGLYFFYASTVHPTVMRYKAGTLEKDVRGDLIQEVKKNKNWIYSVDIEFDKLAAMPKFEGHNSISLLSLYAIMMGAVMTLSGQQSKREVTVEQVEEWWNTSKRKSKSKSLIEKEQVIINAYLEAKQELKTGFK